jgi:1-phosphofructokinase
MSHNIFGVVTVTLNPAIDRTVTIPNFTAGKVNRVEEVRSNAGGKGVNVASALSDFGHDVAATGFLGSENTELFEELLDRKQIGDLFVRVSGHTRVAIKITDPILRQTTEINFPGAAPDAMNIEALRGQLDHLSAPKSLWFVLAGSVPPGVDPAIYREFVTLLRSRGHKVVLDTSGEPLQHGLEAVPHVIKPNIHELEALLGTKLETPGAVIDAARSLIKRGIEMVVVSMGPDGALFVSEGHVVLARPPNINVRSTVGAGDAMVAGIVAAQLRGLSLSDCARMATAFSVETLIRGEAGVTSSAAIEAAMQEVTIEEPALLAGP